jgi:hypothetical protein
MSQRDRYTVPWATLAISALLAVAPFMGCFASDPGDPCHETESGRCSLDGNFKSFCFNGRWASVQCLGPRGCSSFSLSLCDQRIGQEGLACDPNDGWTRQACSLSGDAELRCDKTGVFVKVSDCPSGCVLNPDNASSGSEVDCR